MSTLLAYVETQDGQVKRSSLEVLSRCKEIASGRGADVAAAVVDLDAARYTDELGRYGASRVYGVSDDAFTHPPTVHRGPRLKAALARIVEASGADVLVCPSTEAVKEVLGALSVRLDAPALPDVSQFEVMDGAVEAVRPVLASKFLARVRAEGTPVLVSVRSGSYTAQEHPVEASFEPVDVTSSNDSAGATLRELITSGGGAVDLSEARIVVAAGRGVRDDEGKALVQELADVLGAAIGSSRAVVESGLFPPGTQVGQTGKVVSPDLYIALGISGAIQHAAGMTGSRVIVAVNKDPDAPIFRYATYGIVGDLYEVVPKLIAALKST